MGSSTHVIMVMHRVQYEQQPMGRGGGGGGVAEAQRFKAVDYPVVGITIATRHPSYAGRQDCEASAIY